MKALITGANGFVGTHLIRYLLNQSDNELIAVDGPNGSTTSDVLHDKVIRDRVDLTDKWSIRDLIKRHKPDQVYHLGGIAVTHGISAQDYYTINTVGTAELAQAVLDDCRKDTKFLFVSSSAVYGSEHFDGQAITEVRPLRPKNPYAASKACAEMLLWTLKSRGLNLCIVRPFNHTGPGQRLGFVIPDIMNRLKNSIRVATSTGNVPALTVGRLDSVRDFTDVRDVVRAYHLIMDKAASGTVANVATKTGYSIGEILQHICREIAQLPDVTVIQDEDLSDRIEQDILVGDNTLLTTQFGWKAEFSLTHTLNDMWNEVGANS